MSEKNVLMINEDVEVRRNLREILVDADWRIKEASSALEGLKLIQDARSFGDGYNYILTEGFLPDCDGKLFLRTMRKRFPKLPIVVVTSYGGAARREIVSELGNSAYLENPVTPEELLAAMASVTLDGTTATPEPAPPIDYLDAPVVGYAFLSIEQRERAAELFNGLDTLPGVVALNAVRGDYDIVLRIAVEDVKSYECVLADISKMNGLKLAFDQRIVAPGLNIATDEFIRHFQDVHLDSISAFLKGNETNSYLLIDIDRYQIERIYCSIMFTSGVVHCRVGEGANRLVVLVSGAVSPQVIRHLLRKLAEMDGILRVREIPVINVDD